MKESECYVWWNGKYVKNDEINVKNVKGYGEGLRRVCRKGCWRNCRWWYGNSKSKWLKRNSGCYY